MPPNIHERILQVLKGKQVGRAQKYTVYSIESLMFETIKYMTVYS